MTLAESPANALQLSQAGAARKQGSASSVLVRADVPPSAILVFGGPSYIDSAVVMLTPLSVHARRQRIQAEASLGSTVSGILDNDHSLGLKA